ncbi:MAG: DUF2505 family protein, partial [Deltaproteobacteria bacterium]|nr:DUF2505 family protein [Deltaproteobacteria bacterium]
MRQFKTSHDIQCAVDTFWQLMLDEKYTRDLYLNELAFKELEVLELSDTVRRLRCVPKLNMPGPVAKLLGDRFSYEEQCTLDRTRSEWRWKLIPSTLASKIRVQGIVRVESLSDDQCRRFDDATMEAKVFGIGKLLESSTEKEMQRTFDS